MGTLILPDSRRNSPIVIGVHGAQGGTRDFVLHRHLVALLASIGVGTFIYDRRGEGQSDGEAHIASFEDLAHDLLAAIRTVRDQPGVDPGRIGLWALSQGGWIAPLAASQTDDVAFLIAVSPCGLTPSAQMTFAVTTVLREAGHGEEVIEQVRELRAHLDLFFRTGEGKDDIVAMYEAARAEPWFSMAYIPDPRATGRQWPKIMHFDVRPALARLGIPVLLIHGEHDRWVPVEESIEVWRSALAEGGGQLTVVRIAGAGHAMMPVPTNGYC
jgi:uncharacterized protein